MKAAVVVAPDELVITDLHDPEVGPYEALCENLYGAVCTGTDRHIVAGIFEFAQPCPTILGHETIGRVIEVGDRVRHFKAGDLVTRVGAPTSAKGEYTVTWGGFATLGVARDHWAMARDGLSSAEYSAHRVNQIIPTGIGPDEATMLITWRETLSYATRMGVSAGARVLVIGSGGNGLAFANHAANLGARCVAVLGAANREEVAYAVGATHYACYSRDEAAAELHEVVGEGFDFVIDAVGRQGNADMGLAVVAPGGCVGIYGMDDFGKCSIDPAVSGNRSFRFYAAGYDEPEMHGAVCDLVRAGRLKAEHWLSLGNPYPLAGIAQALADLSTRKAGPKALVRLN